MGGPRGWNPRRWGKVESLGHKGDGSGSSPASPGQTGTLGTSWALETVTFLETELYLRVCVLEMRVCCDPLDQSQGLSGTPPGGSGEDR